MQRSVQCGDIILIRVVQPRGELTEVFGEETLCECVEMPGGFCFFLFVTEIRAWCKYISIYAFPCQKLRFQLHLHVCSQHCFR